MSTRKGSPIGTGVTVVLNFAQAVVMTWAATETEGVLRVALCALVTLYVIAVLVSLVVLQLVNSRERP